MASTHGIKLIKGVRELIRTDDTTLEDLHMVATDLILTIDKLSEKLMKKLKQGQKIRVYDEESNKDYGKKGSDTICYFLETRDLKTKGVVLRVYDQKHEWSIEPDGLLEVYDEFDPESSEGKKRDNDKAKKKGRKPRKSRGSSDHNMSNYSPQFDVPELEAETENEEYTFNSPAEWEEFFPNDY